MKTTRCPCYSLEITRSISCPFILSQTSNKLSVLSRSKSFLQLSQNLSNFTGQQCRDRQTQPWEHLTVNNARCIRCQTDILAVQKGKPVNLLVIHTPDKILLHAALAIDVQLIVQIV